MFPDTLSLLELDFECVWSVSLDGLKGLGAALRLGSEGSDESLEGAATDVVCRMYDRLRDLDGEEKSL